MFEVTHVMIAIGCDDRAVISINKQKPRGISFRKSALGDRGLGQFKVVVVEDRERIRWGNGAAQGAVSTSASNRSGAAAIASSENSTSPRKPKPRNRSS